MAKYRQVLPQLGGGLVLTDGGLETNLLFNEGFELPHLAAIALIDDPNAMRAIESWLSRHAGIAKRVGAGFVLESNTWRGSPDWGARLGWTPGRLARANRAAVAMLDVLRERLETPQTPMPISGCVGPRGDGYDPGRVMTPDAARAYHAFQIRLFADTAADFVTAMTITNAPEAIGIVRAAQTAAMPVAISFTVETDGRLPTGQPLAEAIDEVDAACDGGPAYYMINCAHPQHFRQVLQDAPWARRLRGLRANASCLSHAELDQSTELDTGDPVALGGDYAEIRAAFPWINVLGGCCGTDHRHVAEIAAACCQPV
jgi:S-methylmethionine-dependent homocysteine/selenocysteine methylase